MAFGMLMQVNHHTTNVSFWVRKVVCVMVQMYFFLYEMVQIRKQGKTYWYNYWNYFEIL